MNSIQNHFHVVLINHVITSESHSWPWRFSTQENMVHKYILEQPCLTQMAYWAKHHVTISTRAHIEWLPMILSN